MRNIVPEAKISYGFLDERDKFLICLIIEYDYTSTWELQRGEQHLSSPLLTPFNTIIYFTGTVTLHCFAL